MNYHTSYSVPVSQPSEVLGPLASCISFPIYPPFKAPSEKKKNHKFPAAYPDLIPISFELLVALEPSR